MKMAHSPPGHHSVTGRPSVNGLALAEYVIYRGEQVNSFLFWFFRLLGFGFVLLFCLYFKAYNVLGFFLTFEGLGLAFVLNQSPDVVADERNCAS